VNLLAVARQELLDFAPTPQPFALLLEGSWPEEGWSLDDAIDARHAWIDEAAAYWAEYLEWLGQETDGNEEADGTRSVPATLVRRGSPDPALTVGLNALALRYYFVKLLRVVAYFTEVRPLGPDDRLELVAQRGRDEDYADLIGQLCRRAEAACQVHWVDRPLPSGPAPAANGRWRRLLGRVSQLVEPSVQGDLSRVVLCGNPRLLGPVCEALVERSCQAWWLYDRFAVGSWLRWRARGVGQLTCDSSLGLASRLVVPEIEPIDCRGVNLAGSLQRWLAERVRLLGSRQTRILEQLDAHFRRVRPDALVLDEDATPLARAAVAVAREHGAASLVVQHGAPCCRFGFSPLAADRILVWGRSSADQLVRWAVPAERIEIVGSPQHDRLRRALAQRAAGRTRAAVTVETWAIRDERAARSLARSEPAMAVTADLETKKSSNARNPSASVTRTESTFPLLDDDTGEEASGSAPCTGALTKIEFDPRPVRILLLATVPPRDQRPDAVLFHMTRQSYAELLRAAVSTVAGIPNAELLVKPHPRSLRDPLLEAVLSGCPTLRSRVIGGPLERCLADVDCVLSCGSSAGVDAALAGVPVIQLLPAGSGEVLPHEAWGMLGTARSAEELQSLLAEALTTGCPTTSPANPNVFGRSCDDSADRIAEAVLREAGCWKAPPAVPDVPSVPRPVSGWRRVVADCAVVSGATVLGHVLSTVTALVLRMLLDPALMGVWQGLKIFLHYSNYANLGVSKSATRDLTVALGRGDPAAAQQCLNLAFAVNSLTSVLFALVPIGAGLWMGWRGGWTNGWAIGLIVIGVLVVLQRHLTFLVSILRAKQAFGLTSRVSILEAALTLVFCGLATWQWGLWGLFGGTIAVMGVTLLFVQHKAAMPLAWDWDWRPIGRLVLAGSPMLLAGTVSTLFRSLDKLMILGCLSDREFQLGCYSVALLVTGQLYGLANMLSIVMGPRYGETFGQSGSRSETARLAAWATELQSAAMALPSALSIVLAPALLAWLLPEYRSGLAPLVWLVPGTIGLSIALPASQYLIAVDRQGRALLSVVVATAITAAANYAALVNGFGLVGVAAATMLGYAAYGLLTVAISLWPELDARSRSRLVAMQILTNVPPLGLALLLETLWPGTQHGMWLGAAKGVAVAAAWGLTVLVGWRLGHWAEALACRRKSPQGTVTPAR